MDTTHLSRKKLLLKIVVLFIATRIVLTIIGMGSLAMIDRVYHTRVGTPEPSIVSAPLSLKAWASWDSTFYVRIANYGYPRTFNPAQYNSFGFFFGYPFIVSLLSTFFLYGHTVLAGIIVSSAAFIAAAYFFYRLIEKDYGPKIAETSLMILFLQPFGFIFSAVMSESVFLLLSVLAFRWIRNDKPVYAALAIFLATLTRAVGIVLVIPIAFLIIKKYYQKIYSLPKTLSTLLVNGIAPILSIFITFGYMYAISGDFFAYIHTQGVAWKHHLTNPFYEIYQAFKIPDIHTKISVVFLLLYTLILLIPIKKLKPEYILYGLPLLYFHTFSATVYSSVRYGVVVFPIVLAEALMLKTENQKQIAYILLAMIQASMMIAWTLGIVFTL
jgi:Gpi18-like mannosyltransferase